MTKYVDYVEMDTDCTSSDKRYSSGSRVLGSVRYALRMARAARENDMPQVAAGYLAMAQRSRQLMAPVKEERR